MGLKLTHLVSTTAASRETAARHGLLERIDINEFANDERESTPQKCEQFTSRAEEANELGWFYLGRERFPLGRKDDML